MGTARASTELERLHGRIVDRLTVRSVPACGSARGRAGARAWAAGRPAGVGRAAGPATARRPGAGSRRVDDPTAPRPARLVPAPVVRIVVRRLRRIGGALAQRGEHQDGDAPEAKEVDAGDHQQDELRITPHDERVSRRVNRPAGLERRRYHRSPLMARTDTTALAVAQRETRGIAGGATAAPRGQRARDRLRRRRGADFVSGRFPHAATRARPRGRRAGARGRRCAGDPGRPQGAGPPSCERRDDARRPAPGPPRPGDPGNGRARADRCRRFPRRQGRRRARADHARVDDRGTADGHPGHART